MEDARKSASIQTSKSKQVLSWQIKLKDKKTQKYRCPETVRIAAAF